MTGNLWVGWGGALAFLSVAAGAFGSHALAERLDPRSLGIFEIAVRYQMYHGLALILYGLFVSQVGYEALSRPASFPGFAFLLGVLFFSGSLYALALSGVRILGAITPIGGVFFLIGWASWAYQAFRHG